MDWIPDRIKGNTIYSVFVASPQSTHKLKVASVRANTHWLGGVTCTCIHVAVDSFVSVFMQKCMHYKNQIKHYGFTTTCAIGVYITTKESWNHSHGGCTRYNIMW